MQPNQNGFVLCPGSFYKSAVFNTVTGLPEWYELKVTEYRGQFDFFTFLNNRIPVKLVPDEIADRDYLYAEFLSDLHQVREAGHATIIIHNLHQGSSRSKSCEPGKVNNSFGMPRSSENPFSLAFSGNICPGLPRSVDFVK